MRHRIPALALALLLALAPTVYAGPSFQLRDGNYFRIDVEVSSSPTQTVDFGPVSFRGTLTERPSEDGPVKFICVEPRKLRDACKALSTGSRARLKGEIAVRKVRGDETRYAAVFLVREVD